MNKEPDFFLDRFPWLVCLGWGVKILNDGCAAIWPLDDSPRPKVILRRRHKDGLAVHKNSDGACCDFRMLSDALGTANPANLLVPLASWRPKANTNPTLRSVNFYDSCELIIPSRGLWYKQANDFGMDCAAESCIEEPV